MRDVWIGEGENSEGEGTKNLQLKEGTTMEQLIFKVSKVSGNEAGKPEHKFTLGELATAFSAKASTADLTAIAKVILGDNAEEPAITQKVTDLKTIAVNTGKITINNDILSVDTGILSAEALAILKKAEDESAYNISVYYGDNSGGPASDNRLAQIAITKDDVKFVGVNKTAIVK